MKVEKKMVALFYHIAEREGFLGINSHRFGVIVNNLKGLPCSLSTKLGHAIKRYGTVAHTVEDVTTCCVWVLNSQSPCHCYPKPHQILGPPTPSPHLLDYPTLSSHHPPQFPENTKLLRLLHLVRGLLADSHDGDFMAVTQKLFGEVEADHSVPTAVGVDYKHLILHGGGPDAESERRESGLPGWGCEVGCER
nr:hypothetical protein Iba_chr08aCG8090 [Ipomoea batatas]